MTFISEEEGKEGQILRGTVGRNREHENPFGGSWNWETSPFISREQGEGLLGQSIG